MKAHDVGSLGEVTLDLPEGKARPRWQVSAAHETRIQVRSFGAQVGTVIQPVSDAGTLKRTWP